MGVDARHKAGHDAQGSQQGITSQPTLFSRTALRKREKRERAARKMRVVVKKSKKGPHPALRATFFREREKGFRSLDCPGYGAG
jgi:hypothetical protein